MLATNHGLVGIAIGGLLPIPIALPVAFASHYALDALPHYGVRDKNRNKQLNRAVVFIDTAIALSFALITALLGEWEMFIVGWVAYSPDLQWVYLYFKQKGNLHLKTNNKFGIFHKKIQREYPWGLLVELPLMASMIFIVTILIVNT